VAASPLLQFQPLRDETVARIRARIDADINAGRSPESPEWRDTTEGSVTYDITQACVIELARLWDFASSEVLASVFLPYSWGPWLDAWGVTLNRPRKAEVAASGAVAFVGAPGTLVATGTRVSTVPTDPDAEPQEFGVTVGRVLAAEPGPTGLARVASGTGGTLAAGTYYYVVTGLVGGFETVVSNRVSATVAGATSSVALTWAALAGATAYRVYRGTVAGEEFRLVEQAGAAYTDVGGATSGDRTPTNLISVEAVEPGAEGNVPAGAISQLVSPVSGVTAVSNPSPTSGGAGVETDDLYRTRLLLEYGAAQGSGNIDDYKRWALDYPPIGFVTVEPEWLGANTGTVRVIITDQANNPMAASVVAGLQARLDPVAGLGQGLAPIGAKVTVTTPTQVTVAVAATLTLRTGYSLDGAGGTIAVRAAVEQALSDYIDSLAAGEDVILNHVEARFFAVEGVYNVAGVTLNGAAANVAIGSGTPPEVPTLGAVTLA
jgi:uncharacterized phage protein gp47/JayE